MFDRESLVLKRHSKISMAAWAALMMWTLCAFGQGTVAPPTLEQQILDRLAQGRSAQNLLDVYLAAQPQATKKTTALPAVQTEAQQFKNALRTLRQALAQAQAQTNEESTAALRDAYQRFLAAAAILENAFADTEKRLNEAGLAAVMMPRHEAARAKIMKEVNAVKAALDPLQAASQRSSAAENGAANTAPSSSKPPSPLVSGALPQARQAVETLIGREGEGTPLRAVMLPARASNLPARLPVTTPAVTPVYALSDETLVPVQVTAADTVPTLEAPFADEILAQAEALKYDYAAIYEYVRNTIQTEWYVGSGRGAIGTLRAKRGNDIDQASLLIALLRASGAPARYIHGVIELPVETVAASLNLADASQAPEALTRAGVANRSVVRGGRVAAVEVEHTWVATRVPYTNYRGALVDATGPTWLPLDPSIKTWVNVTPTGILPKMLGGGNSAAMVDAYLQQTHDGDFLTDLREQIKTYLQSQGNGGYEAQLGSQTIREQIIGLLPNTLPYTVIAVTGEQTDLDLAHQGTVRFRFYTEGNDTTPVMEAMVPVSELSQQRLTLSYQPATLEDHRATLLYGGMDLVPIYLIQLRPELRLNGKQIAIGNTPMASGTLARLEITLHNAAGDETVEQYLQTAAYHAFAIGHGEPTRPEVSADNGLESEAARQLDGLAVAYSRGWFEAEEELSALNATPVVRPYPGIAMTSTAFAVETVAGVPYTQKWRGVTLDAALRIAEPVGSQMARRDWLRLSALQGSSLEHRIFEQQFLVDAVSADKVLGLMTPANVITLTAGNLEAALATLGLSNTISDDLRSAVHLGYTIKIGASALQRNIWNGNAWWIENPVNGAAGWFIAGKLAGGSTTEDPAAWVLQFLVDAFMGANSPAPNEDPLAGTSITRVTATDGQEGIVNQVLTKALQVMVRDKNGRPVKGASVTFLAGRGKGVFGGSSNITVTTDATGLASATYTLGKSTADWPVYVKRQSGDEYLTQAGYNTIDARLQSATGTYYLEAPFIAKALPDTATKLVRTDKDDLVGEANIGGGTAILRATDTYDNPVANVEITAAGGMPFTSCDPAPQTPPQPAKFAHASWTDSGCPSTPTSNDCGQTPLMLKTRTDGTVAFFVFLGNSNASRYPVVFSGAAASLAQEYQTGGACNSGPELLPLYVVSINNQGDLAAATYPATLYARALEVRAFYTKPSYQVYKAGGYCYLRYLPDRQLIPVPSAQVSFAYSNGGSATAAVAQGNGGWGTQMTTGPLPALDAGTTRFTNAEYKYDVVDPITCEVSTQIGYTSMNGGAPGVWAVQAQIADIRSLDVEEGVDPGRLYLNDDGGTRYPLEIQYRIEPLDYVGNYVDVLMYETSPKYGRQAYFAQKGTTAGGIGTIRLERGFPFDSASTYTVQVRVNPGSIYDEVLSEEVPLLLHQRLIRSYTDSAVMQTDVDLINDRACRLGSSLDFYLNRASQITLTVDPLDDTNDPHPVGNPTTLINSVLYTADETHSYALDPAALLPRRNGYLFTLRAVNAADPSQAEEVQGVIRVGLNLHDTLPVQQTLVKGVNIKSGRLATAALGFEYQGRGPQLAFRPMYSSGGETLGAMGYGWTHNFEASLQITPCGDVLVQTGDGGSVRFLPDSGHSFKPAKGYHGTLIADEVNYAFDFYGKDGKRYRFKFVGGKSQWRLDKITDTNGNALEFFYGETGDSGEALLKQVKDGSGRVLTYQYETRNFSGNVASALVGVAGTGSVQFKLDYDTDGNLVAIDKNQTAQESFAYNINQPLLRHLMTAATNANGNTTQYEYDTTDISYTLPGAGNINISVPNGRVKTVVTPEGGATSFVYGTAQVQQPQTTKVTDPSGLTTYTTDTYGSPIKIESPAGITTMSWRSDDVLLDSRTDPGNITTRYQYDAAGNVTQEDIGSFTSKTAWLIQDAPPYLKNLPTARVDRNGHVTTYAYDNAGNLQTETRPESVVLNYTYAGNGDRLTAVDGNNHTTRYTYDARGLPSTKTDPLNFGTSYSYDARGRLQRVALPNAAATNYIYDDLDRLTGITDAEGGVTAFEYDAVGNKTAETDAEGRVTRWTYDKQNRVLTQTTPVGRKTYTYDLAGNKKTETNWRGDAVATYDYDGANRLTKRTETGGLITEYSYGAAGDRVSEIDAEGRATNYEYDLLHRRTKTTDALGFERTTEYDGNGNITRSTDAEGRVTTYAYDGLNRRIQTIAADGGISTAEYDKAGNLLKETDGEGQVTVHSYDNGNRRSETTDGEGKKTSYTYDKVGNLTKEINPRIYARDYSYDGLGRRLTINDEGDGKRRYTTAYAYDKVGNRKTETWPNDNKIEHDYDAANRKIASRDGEGSLGGWEYDGDGNLTKEIDGNSNITTHDYDELSGQNSRRIKTVLPALPGAATRLHQYSYDKAGNLIKETDSSGNTRVHTYDELNRRTKTTDDVGNVGDFSYDKVGNLTAEKNGLGEETVYGYDVLNRRNKQQDSLGVVWTKTYDKAGNLSAEADGNGNLTVYTYDKNNRQRTVTRAGLLIETREYDPAGNLLFRTDARGTKEGWEYDPRNLAIAHNRPLAMITKFSRDAMGDIIEERDPENRLTQNTWDQRRRLASKTVNGNETSRYAYDANGNRSQTIRPGGGTTAIVYTAHNRPGSIATAAGASYWTYNGNGVAASRTDGNGHTTTYTTDRRDRRSKTTYPGSTGETVYTYDLADRLKTAAENSITTTRSFDARGRETQRAYSGGSLNKTLYGYDGNGNLTSETVTDNTGTRTTYTQYDAFDRPERVTDAYGNLLIQAYDANGNRSQTTAPGINGNQVSRYTWDVNDNLVSLATGNAVINWQYDRSGKVTRTTYPGGTVTDQTWDNAARLQTRSHKAAGSQQSFAYTYDKNGNRSQETRNLGTAAETISYTYDADDRLTGVQGSGWSETYTLDSTGNRKQTTRSGYGAVQNTFDERGQLKQRQTPAETVTYIWDQAGNLSQSQSGGQTTTYTWDGEHQLVEIKHNGTTVASYRYTGGLRDQSQSGSGNYRTVWDGGFAFIEQDSSGQTLTRTEHAAEKAIYLTGTSGNEVLLRDGLDSVTGSIANGALQSSTAYSAWGEASQTGATQSNHGYTGHLKDDTGLIYAKARYYDPGIGRFISKDPLEGLQDSPITWNAYLYGNGNPFYYVDPTGQAAFLTDAEEVSKASVDIWKERREAAIAEGAALRALGTGFAEGLATIGYGASWLLNATSDLLIKNNNLPGMEEATQAMTAKETAAADFLNKAGDVVEILKQDPAGAARQIGAGLVDFGYGIATGEAQAWGKFGQMASFCALTPAACARGVAGVGTGAKDMVLRTEAFLTEQANGLGTAGRATMTVRSAEAVTSAGDVAKRGGWPGTGGVGPVNGTVGITDQTSVAALQNYYPRGGGIEFVYDPASRTFVAGRPAAGFFEGSPHQQLAQSIGATNRPVVGGTLQRGTKGEFITTENSGHFGQNWTDSTRQQFQTWLSDRTGMLVSHKSWGQ